MNGFGWQVVNANKKQRNSSLPEWFEAASFSAAFIIVLFLFFVRVVLVSGPSMLPTLHNNDRVLVQSFFYTLKNNDVIVVDGFTAYGKPLVKRIIGRQGDEIYINNESGQLFVNGNKITEPYVTGATYPLADTQYPLTVPTGKLFVMGDNRELSLDSRSSEIGFLDERDILGKVIARIYPFKNPGVIK